MITFKSKKKVNKPDIFVSEVRLKKCNSSRRGKVQKLLKLLTKEEFDENIS